MVAHHVVVSVLRLTSESRSTVDTGASAIPYPIKRLCHDRLASRTDCLVCSKSMAASFRNALDQSLERPRCRTHGRLLDAPIQGGHQRFGLGFNLATFGRLIRHDHHWRLLRTVAPIAPMQSVVAGIGGLHDGGHFGRIVKVAKVLVDTRIGVVEKRVNLVMALAIVELLELLLDQ
jgi:hypothetical protein